MTKISLIWAEDSQGGIAKQGVIPWHLTEDFQYFKEKTLNKTIIMGRKTWESLPMKPLPKRRNIILSNNANFLDNNYSKFENTFFIDNLKKMEDLNCSQNFFNGDEIFIIGGKQLYSEFIGIAETVYITRIDYDYQCDLFAPKLTHSYKLISESNQFISLNDFAPDGSKLKYVFLKYQNV